MIFTITRTIDINEDEIIEDFGLTNKSCRNDIEDAVHGYVCRLDDADFYIIGNEEEKQIIDKIVEILGVDK
jgi:hypothetical protein